MKNKRGPTYKTINREITKWFFGDKYDVSIDYLFFHCDHTLLLKAVAKIMLEKKCWLSIYSKKITIIKNGKNKILNGFKCAFNKNGYGRMGYGSVWEQGDFTKETIHKATWYSLYRLIKFGFEY